MHECGDTYLWNEYLFLILEGGRKTKEIVEKDIIIIEDVIYEIRGVQVMLDSDLAKLYKYANGTKDINKAVKKNINRFPSDFYMV